MSHPFIDLSDLADLLEPWFDDPYDIPSVYVKGLKCDSRRIRPDELFFALSGKTGHGLSYAQQAVERGACAIIYDPAGADPELVAKDWGVPLLELSELNYKAGYIADFFYDGPSAKMEVIAVTGTNGKTSCSHFLAQLLEDEGTSAVIGTLGWGQCLDSLESITHTTPHALDIHRYFSILQEQGVRYVAMEASSHGLEQWRLNGVRISGALFTNFSRDHLDYHGDMKAYLKAKLRLLDNQGLKFIAFNLDDASAERIMKRAEPDLLKIGFTRRAAVCADQDIKVLAASNIKFGSDGIAFQANFAGQSVIVTAPVCGDFNVENVLGCLAVLLARGANLEDAARKFTRITPVNGRMDVLRDERGVNVVVDYAHSPDALEKLLRTVKMQSREGSKLCVVMGCGGDRDQGKRPQMGAIAERYADVVILTDDNPRFEEGDKIIADILAGCEQGDHRVIRDRAAAITEAVKLAAPGDTVVVAGKGHETSQETAGKRLPFSDKEVVKQVFQAISVERKSDVVV